MRERVTLRVRLRQVLLIVVLLASGTPYLLSFQEAREALASQVEVSNDMDVLSEPSRVGGAPPASDEMRSLQQAPALSGANPPYPRNHMLDDDPEFDIGTPPSNHDFESPGYQVGTPPSNFDLEAPSQEVGTPPTNNDFETGDFTGWSTVGSPTIESDPTNGSYGKVDASGDSLTTAAFTVESTAQVFSFDLFWASTTTYSGVKVYVLSGGDFSTQTEVLSEYCYRCGTWEAFDLSTSSWLGQSVKLKIDYYNGPTGVDNVRTRTLFPDMTTSGPVTRGAESTNDYAVFTSGGILITEPFTVDSSAQLGTVQARKSGTYSAYFYIYALSGVDYSTETQLFYGSTSSTTWETIHYNLSGFAGQSIKLKYRKYGVGTGHLDDLAAQRVEVVDWDGVTEDARVEEEAGNHYVSTNGELYSHPFTLPADVDHLLLRYRGGSSTTIFRIRLFGGPSYDDELFVVQENGEQGVWNTLKIGVGDYAGQSVKIKLEQYWGRLHFDDVGTTEKLLPGWQLTGTSPLVTGENEFGSYVAPVDKDIFLRASNISTGLVDMPGNEFRFYSATYVFGNETASLFRVWWHDAATGDNWVVLQDASDVATEVRTRYFYVADFMGEDGYFTVQVPGEGKFYSLGDNIARQQLSEPFSEKVGYNIDTSTGAFGYQVTDLATAGVMPLQFTRYFNAHSDHYGSLGYRWTHSYDTRLVVLDNDDAGVVFGSGREVFFDWYTYIGDPPNRYIPADPRNHETLEKNGDGTYTFATVDNLSYHFDADGVLLTISDLNGNTVTLNRDGHGRVTNVSNTAGRTLTVTYDANGRVATVTDPVGAVVSYSYDANGDLTMVNDVESDDWTYSYDRHRLISVTAPDSTVVFTNTLDGLHRVTSQSTPGNATIHLDYDSPGQGATQVTDAENNTATYYFDKHQRTTHKVDSLGNVWTTEYDADGNLQKRINPEGEAWTFAYDSDGNRTSETDPLGNPTSYTYNPLRQPETVTDARGKVWTNVYDSLGNLISTTDPLDNTTSYTYDANGNVTSVTDALNNTTSYIYDGAGNRTSMTDARNKTWTWTYDAAGRMLTETTPLNETTTYTRNLFGWITKIEDPLGHAYTFTYDIWGNLVTHTDPLGNVTTWGYNARADVVSKTDPLGKVTTYTYDDNHNMISMTDPLNRTTTWTYDSLDRLTGTTDSLNRTTTYTYDDADRLIAMSDLMNRTTTYAYDDAGRLTSKTLPDGGVWNYTYDANGNLLTETNPRNYTTTFAYDDVNRLTSMTDALSGVVSFGYDGVGNRTSLTDPRNNTWTYTYDAVGNLLTETDPLSRTISWTYDGAERRATQTDQRGIQISYGYDAAGNLTSITAPTETVSYSYDNADRLTSMTDGTGTTSWSYDNMSRVTSVTAPQGTVSYTYDDVGQRTSMILPSSRTVSYDYDAAGNLTSLTDWQSRVVSFTYNAANQRTGISRPNGVSTSYGYDTGGRLTSIVHADGGGTLQSYSYTLDAMGNRTAVTTPDGTENYTLDELNRLTNVTYANGDVVSYTYDAAGNRLTQTVNGVTTNTYTYDTAGQMTSDGVTTYTYDAAGNLLTAGADSYSWDWKGRLASATVGGTTVSYAYDGMDVRTSETVGGVTTPYLWDRAEDLPLLVDDGTNGYLHADGLIAEITNSGAPTYHLTDALGTVRGLTDLTGTLTGASDFDVFGDVRDQIGTASIFGFTGEQRDATTGMTYLRARYYEPGYGRFVSADTVQPGGPGTQGFNRYAYVGNNPCTATDPSGHCSPEIIAATWGAVAWWVTEAWKYSAAGRTNPNAAARFILATALFTQFLFFVIVWCIFVLTSEDGGASGPSSDGPPPDLPSAPDNYPSSPLPPAPGRS